MTVALPSPDSSLLVLIQDSHVFVPRTSTLGSSQVSLDADGHGPGNVVRRVLSYEWEKHVNLPTDEHRCAMEQSDFGLCTLEAVQEKLGCRLPSSQAIRAAAGTGIEQGDEVWCRNVTAASLVTLDLLEGTLAEILKKTGCRCSCTFNK